MTDNQTRHLNAGKAGKKILDDNSVLWDSVLARANKRTALGLIITFIEGKQSVQEIDITGKATNKEKKKEAAANKALIVAKGLTELARDTSNSILEAEIDFELRDLLFVKDVTAVDRWKLVFDRATSNLAPLTATYGLTPVDVTDVDTARLAFINVQSDPEVAIDGVGSATLSLEEAFKSMSTIVSSVKNLAILLPTAQVDLKNSIFEAFEIDNTGIRHVRAVFIFKDFDTGVLLPKVKTKFIAANGDVVGEKFSTPLGSEQWKGIGNGNFRVVSELPGYDADDRNNVPIEEGKILKLEIKLHKKP